ncbi:MAG: HD-GYP domain-containing protein [Mobilitalea sp.]
MKHVLIADRDFAILKSKEQALQDKYEVSSVSIDEGLNEYLVDHPVDIILLAVSELKEDSFHDYDIIKMIPEMIGKPVIFLAKQSDAALESKALSIGADDFIAMPFTSEMLIHRIDKCLELQDLRNDRSYVDKYLDAVSISFAELVECRDVTTGGHLKNTTRYFKILLEEAIKRDYKEITPTDDVKDLLRSAALHDIGKIGINDEILRKAAALDYNEYEYMKTHTILGKQVFEKIIQETGGTKWLYLAKDLAYCHHERWDGTGYPNGLKGEEIPFYARMLTVADVYDALTSRRSYKDPYTHQMAMDIIIEGKGSIFDPNLVDLFVETNERFKEVLLGKKSDTVTIERE